jgi:hypothetical protein
MSGLQTTDFRIRFSEDEVAEMTVIIRELLSERSLDSKPDLVTLPELTRHLRELLVRLLEDEVLSGEIAKTLDDDREMGITRCLEGEDAVPEFRQLKQKLSKGIALEHGPSPDTFDIYNFV